jgi:hypothetical protein
MQPAHISYAEGIKFVNVSFNAKISNEVVRTGSWRNFQFIDADGSFMETQRPTLVGSYSDINTTDVINAGSFNWWRLDDACQAYGYAGARGRVV